MQVESILEVVDNVLGILSIDTNKENCGSRVRNPQQSKAYLFISNKTKQVIGLLLAEIIDKISDTVSLAIPSKESSNILSDTRMLHDVSDRFKQKVVAGISRIWVHSEFQRQGVATRLVDAMCVHFMMPERILKIGQFAFSHTTPNGTGFATKYLKNEEFLTYAPNLPGHSIVI